MGTKCSKAGVTRLFYFLFTVRGKWGPGAVIGLVENDLSGQLFGDIENDRTKEIGGDLWRIPGRNIQHHHGVHTGTGIVEFQRLTIFRADLDLS